MCSQYHNITNNKLINFSEDSWMLMLLDYHINDTSYKTYRIQDLAHMHTYARVIRL